MVRKLKTIKSLGAVGFQRKGKESMFFLEFDETQEKKTNVIIWQVTNKIHYILKRRKNVKDWRVFLKKGRFQVSLVKGIFQNLINCFIKEHMS